MTKENTPYRAYANCAHSLALCIVVREVYRRPEVDDSVDVNTKGYIARQEVPWSNDGLGRRNFLDADAERFRICCIRIGRETAVCMQQCTQ